MSWPTIPDLSTGGNNGTATNMEITDLVADSPGGTFSLISALFDGVDEYVTMGNVLGAVLEYNLPFSFSCWFKNSSAGNHIILSKQNPGSAFRGVSVFVNVSNVYFQIVNTYSTLRSEIRTSGALYSDGNWHHLVCTYNANTPGDVADMKIYVDGALATPTTISNTLGSNTIANSNSLNVSGRNNGETLFPGNVDEVAVYDKELSLTEVQWIRNSGAPRSLRQTGAPSNLVGWWGMDVSRLQFSVPASALEGPEQEEDDHGQAIAFGTAAMNYLMRGINIGGNYIHWLVTGQPDLQALQAPETIPDLSTVTIAGQWTV